MKLERTNIDQKTYDYSDLDLVFDIHPIKKDLILNKDISAVTKAIRNLILTSHYERPFHPEIGSNVKKGLFELDDGVSHGFIEREIADVITNFEPRVQLSSINVYTTNNYVMVDISFYLTNSSELTNIKIPISRTSF